MVDDRRLVWTFDLAADEQQTLFAWLILAQGPLQLQAIVQSGVAPDTVEQTRATLDLQPQAEPTLHELRLAIAPYRGQRPYARADKYLRWAGNRLQAEDLQGAVTQLLRAADALADIGSAEADAIRVQLGRLLRVVARQF